MLPYPKYFGENTEKKIKVFRNVLSFFLVISFQNKLVDIVECYCFIFTAIMLRKRVVKCSHHFSPLPYSLKVNVHKTQILIFEVLQGPYQFYLNKIKCYLIHCQRTFCPPLFMLITALFLDCCSYSVLF